MENLVPSMKNSLQHTGFQVTASELAILMHVFTEQTFDVILHLI